MLLLLLLLPLAEEERVTGGSDRGGCHGRGRSLPGRGEGRRQPLLQRRGVAPGQRGGQLLQLTGALLPSLPTKLRGRRSHRPRPPRWGRRLWGRVRAGG